MVQCVMLMLVGVLSDVHADVRVLPERFIVPC